MLVFFLLSQESASIPLAMSSTRCPCCMYAQIYFFETPPSSRSPDLYLIRPPAGALHRAIPHSKIIFAGDSAGASLCLTVLTILRDLSLPLPAGAVLISPWVDLTHSFPSVMQNFETVNLNTLPIWTLETNVVNGYLGYYTQIWISRKTVNSVACANATRERWSHSTYGNKRSSQAQVRYLEANAIFGGKNKNNPRRGP
jgi:hypothetical protein